MTASAPSARSGSRRPRAKRDFKRARSPFLRAAALAALVGSLGWAAAARAQQPAPCAEPHPWCNRALSPDQRAGLLVARMTRDEKFELMAGDDPAGVFTGNPAQGTSRGIPRLGIPTVYFSDGPAGVREGEATALPAPIALAASWSPTLAGRYGAVVGNEVFNKGNHVIHAPTVNIMRVPLAGRTFEGYGEDPHLNSRLAVGWIRGAQSQKVIANVKHYAANNQETDRFVTNAVVDERTLREIYLPHFEASVTEAGVGSVMVAYNRVNGTYMAENRPLVGELLKGEWGLDGFVLTDYGFAQRSTVESSKAGTDLELPQAGWYSRPALTLAVTSGSISEAEIDEHVRRILRTMFRFGIFDRPPPPERGNIDQRSHARVAREAAEQGAVLLKNEGGQLPLDAGRLRSIAVIGPEADSYRGGGGSATVVPPYSVTPLEGIRRRAGPGVAVRFDNGSDAARAAAVAGGADVAIVVVNDSQTEFLDKPCLTLRCGDPTNGDQDGLVEAVRRSNPRTVVVLETGGPVLLPWAGDVPAILEAWYPGMEGGNAIAAVLFGDVDPGGRLPVTFPRREEDLPTAGHPERYPGIAENAHYSEGVFVGYRHWDHSRLEPLFPFGHGLSYTSFRYDDLRVEPGGAGRATVSARLTNVGRRSGSEVAQLYLALPQPSPGVLQPPKWLRGFTKVSLRPGESRRVSFRLDPRSFSYWDVARRRWTVASGCYDVLVGRSSRDLRLTGVVSQGGARCAGSGVSPRARIRLSVRPREAVVSRRTRFTFTALRQAGAVSSRLAGAVVRFAGRSARTDRRGQAVIVARLRTAGVHRATATRRGLISGATTVRAVRQPAFTG